MSKRMEKIRAARRELSRWPAVPKSDRPSRCVACGERMADKKYLAPGLFGVMRHECPPCVERGRRSHDESRAVGRTVEARMRDGEKLLRSGGDWDGS